MLLSFICDLNTFNNRLDKILILLAILGIFNFTQHLDTAIIYLHA